MLLLAFSLVWYGFIHSLCPFLNKEVNAPAERIVEVVSRRWIDIRAELYRVTSGITWSGYRWRCYIYINCSETLQLNGRQAKRDIACEKGLWLASITRDQDIQRHG